MNNSAASGLRGFVNHLEEGLMALLLAFMTLITFTQVVLRYVFNTGLVWSLEATTYSFGALVFVGISYGVRTKTHIAVDLVTRRLPEKLRYTTALVAVAFCLIYAAVMLYGSSVLVERLHALGNYARDVPAPKWLLTLTMPVGFALLFYRLSEAAWSICRLSSAEYCAELDADSVARNSGTEDETNQEDLK